MKILNFVAIVSVCCISSQAREWTYDKNGADWDWGFCAGPSQSPIEIDEARSLIGDYIDPFVVSGNWDGELLNCSVQYEGHGFHMLMDMKKGPAFISGGGLPGGKYRLVQFHVHVSNTEHRVVGQDYQGEIHFVFESTVIKDKTQLGYYAVLAFFYEDHKDPEKSEPFFEEMLDAFKKHLKANKDNVIENHEHTFHDFTTVKTEYRDHINGAFYRYNGSLTTPDCTPSVVWTLFQEPIHISIKENDEILRDMPSIDKHNYRSMQDIGERQVFLYQTKSGAQTLLVPFLGAVAMIIFSVVN